MDEARVHGGALVYNFMGEMSRPGWSKSDRDRDQDRGINTCQFLDFGLNLDLNLDLQLLLLAFFLGSHDPHKQRKQMVPLHCIGA